MFLDHVVLKYCICLYTDESNWRNDYPDEESGGPGSSDSEEDYGRSSASYRHREAYYG